MIRRALPAAALLALVAGCAASPPLARGLPPGQPRAVELRDTPFFPQEAFQCGPAALATALRASGVPIEPAALTPEVYLPERQGSLQTELVGATRRHGRLAYRLPGIGDALIAELAEGRPVVVFQNLRFAHWPKWHYAVLIGYDADRNEAILRSGTKERETMRWQRFARSWHTGGRWAISTLPPGVIPKGAEAARYLEAAAGLEVAGQLDGAATSYDAAIARWPGEPLAWLGRGNVAYARGDVGAAAEAYARAVTLAPQDAAARNNLAQALADCGCREEARRQAARASALAAGTSLAKAVDDTRAGIEAAPAGAACPFAGRDWPD